MKEAREFLEWNKIKDYKINPDGTIDVTGSVDIITNQSKFPVKFGRVTEYFRCDGTKLTSLEGAPRHVDGYFSCSYNQLTSLEGAPSYVNGYFYCNRNKLTSLHNIHKCINELDSGFYCDNNPIKDSVLGLLMIKGITRIILDNEEVQNILNKHICQGRAGVIGAQQELLDAGLYEYAKL